MVTKKEAPTGKGGHAKENQIKPSSPSAKQKNEPPDISQHPKYFVGIGGSAGSLEALERFFRSMPADTGVACVVIIHLDPHHKSNTCELLQDFTTMDVCEAEDNMPVRPNAVYIIPPGKNLTILNSTIQITDIADTDEMNMPIDSFFRSLAKDQKDKSIGIILSGMGTDGTLGLRAIQEFGGMTMVQHPDSARYDSMPRSAIRNGLVDFSLTPEKMPKTIINYLRKSPDVIAREALERTEMANLHKIFLLVREQTRVDFSEYKISTVLRRVDRRMNLKYISTLSDYEDFLRNNPKEIDLLYKELLIGVTNFFRDPEAFENLKPNIIQRIKELPPHQTVFRAWCPGCATGEEAFSIAILIRECLEECHLQNDIHIQIYATDISSDEIEYARKGRYPKNIVADVSPTRLKKWFVSEGDSYVVCKDIRESVIFASHNIISDPPFIKLNLICCRNLLIYFTAELQKKILLLFSYALLPHGILFLGTSESLHTNEELFSVRDAKWKIFEHTKTTPHIPGSTAVIRPPPVSCCGDTQGIQKEVQENLPDHIRTFLLKHYTPSSVLITKEGDIVYFSGKTGKYLEPESGRPNLNIFSMIRNEFRIEFETAFHRALLEGEKVTVQGLHTGTGNQEQEFDLTIHPIKKPKTLEDLILVIFRDLPPKPKHRKGTRNGKETISSEFEEELQKIKLHLAEMLEDKQIKEEELKSLNEELQSSNEELQSANEELSTSKEEMQSLNEELQTVNTELEIKNTELAKVNADLINLLNSTDIAMLFLDKEMHISQYTPRILSLYHLIYSDIGRPLSDIVTNLAYDAVIEDAQQVFDTLIIKEKRVQTKDGVDYFMRIVPYKTPENKIEGVVITFTNITAAHCQGRPALNS